MQFPRTLIAITLVALASLFATAPHAPLSRAIDPEAGGRYPNDWFFQQRAFPSGAIPQQAWVAALDQARADRAGLQRARGSEAPTWTAAGPYNIGGRVTAVVAAPGANPVYLGAANGGVFKSTDSGVHWTAVFDAVGATSIGALALDPGDPNVVYAGTGEANSSVDSYDGTGLYRSTNAGTTWQSLGLESTHRIARVAVDPSNSQRIFVAAMGSQFSTGPDRGLYRSEDGGANWSQVLYVSDSTGVCDVVINPVHPETLFCATWERVRRPTYRRAYGPECGVWRSVDSGSHWTRLAGGLPAPSDNLGRIGLAIAKSWPSTVYAQIMSGVSGGYIGLGLYRTQDAGQTWTRRDAGSTFTGSFGGFGWYFGDMAVDPSNANRLFCLGQGLILSTDGGVSFGSALGAAHVDEHAMWIDPTGTSRVYLGNDGGLWRSINGGTLWTQSVDLAITQFYACSVDPSNSNRLLGGAQDNSTSITSGSPTAWSIILGGDGFQSMVSPLDPNLVYAEWQYCCDGGGPRRSINGGGSWGAPSGLSVADRYNWNTPLGMNPLNSLVILAGSQRVYKSTNGGVSYAAVSGDLSTNPGASLVYGTISTLAVSAADTSTYYAGTDDGRVWRSTNGGGVWTNVSAGLPVRYVTCVAPDPVSPTVVYVTLSGFTQDEFVSRVYRSDDAGASWSPIASNLPDAPANDLIVDPTDPASLYVATDVGVYCSRNTGAGWFPLGVGMPLVPVNDLALYNGGGNRILIAATHGRSQWKLDLSGLPAGTPPPENPVTSLAVSPPVPNPSHGTLRLALELPVPTAVEAGIYDLSGRRVRALQAGSMSAGRHVISWDGHDDSGRLVAPGVFFARIQTAIGNRSRTIVRTN